MNSGTQKNASRSRRWRISVSAALLPLCLLAVFVSCRRHSGSALGQERGSLRLQSASFADGEDIPVRFTCDGAGLSPALKWSTAPAGTRSFALVMHDPDAAFDFTHWLAYNLPAGIQSLPEGASRQFMPQDSAEGTNGFNRLGYSGPCPPAGKPHRYVFELYVLDTSLNLEPGASRRDFDSAIARHILAEGRLTGTYQRVGP